MHLRRPSPTTIIAVLALFFALGGTAIAAHHYLIRSTKQIKPSVVRKLRGRAGINGKNGNNGKNGTNGAPGAAGAANGYTDQNPRAGEYIVLEGTPWVVSVLSLPAGKYIVQADVHLEQSSAPGARVTCDLAGTNTPDESVADIGEGGGQVKHADLALSAPLTLTSAGAVLVECTPATVGKVAAGATMTAVQVSNLTSSTG
jgi:hypothetical protein